MTPCPCSSTPLSTTVNERVIGLCYKIPRLRAKANYLLRDTLKVIGSEPASLPGLARPAAALFRTNPDNPMTGGTGHTIRDRPARHTATTLQHHWPGWNKQSI